MSGPLMLLVDALLAIVVGAIILGAVVAVGAVLVRVLRSAAARWRS